MHGIFFADWFPTNSFYANRFHHTQDSKLRQIVTLGSQDTLEEKTVTVCFGNDFVNVTFINFCATRKEIAQVSEYIQRWWNLSRWLRFIWDTRDWFCDLSWKKRKTYVRYIIWFQNIHC